MSAVEKRSIVGKDVPPFSQKNKQKKKPYATDTVCILRCVWGGAWADTFGFCVFRESAITSVFLLSLSTFCPRHSSRSTPY